MDEFTEEAILRRHFGGKSWEEADKEWTYTNATLPDDSTYDQTKFPYYARGPYNPPLPTMDDLALASRSDPTGLERARHGRLIHGKYIVKLSTSKGILEV